MPSQSVTICGPNGGWRDATFHVHAAGCADLGKRAYRGTDPPWTIEAVSQQDVVEATYSDQIAENAGNDWATWKAYASDFRFFPCVDLPVELGIDAEARIVLESVQTTGPYDQEDTVATASATKTGGSKKAASTKKAPAKSAAKTTKKAKAAPTPKVCGCGCGGMTKGGEFVIGHDARHKSNLITKALSGGAGAAAAVKELGERNWTKFLDKSRDVAERKARAAKTAADRKATGKPSRAGKDSAAKN